MMRKSLAIGFLVILALVFGCKRVGKPPVNVQAEHQLKLSSSEIERVFNSLPSPMEVANLFQKSNLTFSGSHLHRVEEYAKYETDEAMALNLGVYSADLSFAIVFEQKDYVEEYFTVIKKLAEKLGILSVISDTVMQQIEANLNDPYKLQKIVSQVFFKTDAFLEDANRQDIITLMLIGGWVETMYLILSFTDDYNLDSSQYVYRLIADQYLVVDQLIEIVKHSDLKQTNFYLSRLNKINKRLKDMVKISFVKQWDPYADTMRDKRVVEYQINERKLEALYKEVSKFRAAIIALH